MSAFPCPTEECFQNKHLNNPAIRSFQYRAPRIIIYIFGSGKELRGKVRQRRYSKCPEPLGRNISSTLNTHGLWQRNKEREASMRKSKINSFQYLVELQQLLLVGIFTTKRLIPPVGRSWGTIAQSTQLFTVV
jgi:hypothetical protein